MSTGELEVRFEGRAGIKRVGTGPRVEADRVAMRQVIKVSPTLLGWIQRAPSRRVSAHRARWAAERVEATDVEGADDV